MSQIFQVVVHCADKKVSFPRVYCLITSKSLNCYRVFIRTLRNYEVDEPDLPFNRDIFVYAFEPSTVHKDFLVNAAFSTATAQSLLKFLSHHQDEENFVRNM